MSRENEKIYAPATMEEIKRFAEQNYMTRVQAKTKINNKRYHEAKEKLKAEVAEKTQMILLEIQCNGDSNSLEHMVALTEIVRELVKAV